MCPQGGFSPYGLYEALGVPPLGSLLEIVGMSFRDLMGN